MPLYPYLQQMMLAQWHISVLVSYVSVLYSVPPVLRNI